MLVCVFVRMHVEKEENMLKKKGSQLRKKKKKLIDSGGGRLKENVRLMSNVSVPFDWRSNSTASLSDEVKGNFVVRGLFVSVQVEASTAELRTESGLP